MKRPDVLFVPEYHTAGARLRSIWPAEALRHEGLSCRVLGGSFSRRDIAPVCVIHRALDPIKLDCVRGFHEAGSFVVLQEDDDIWLSPSSAHDLAREVTEAAAREADRIVVTTPAIRERFLRFNPEVVIVPNRLPAWVGDRAELPRIHEVGWRGAAGHRMDLRGLELPALPAGGRGYAVIGDPAVAELFPAPALAYSWTDHPGQLYSLMQRCRIGIVPLRRHPFNEAKSALAALEWSTVGAAVIASRTGPNAELSRELPILLVEDPPELRLELELLLRDPELAEQLGRAGREAAAALALELHTKEWLEALTA